RFLSEDKQVRRIPFDFPVKETAAARLDKTKTSDVEVTSVPLELKVSIVGVDGDTESGNNDGTLRFRAVTQKRRILIVDGRPRWETRYLRNLFERDEQWEVN